MGGRHDPVGMKDFEIAQEPFLRELADLLSASRQSLAPEFALTEENWDSMTVISCIALIDRHFDVTVPGDSLMACQSVRDLTSAVRTALKASAESRYGPPE